MMFSKFLIPIVALPLLYVVLVKKAEKEFAFFYTT